MEALLVPQLSHLVCIWEVTSAKLIIIFLHSLLELLHRCSFIAVSLACINRAHRLTKIEFVLKGYFASHVRLLLTELQAWHIGTMVVLGCLLVGLGCRFCESSEQAVDFMTRLTGDVELLLGVEVML